MKTVVNRAKPQAHIRGQTPSRRTLPPTYDHGGKWVQPERLNPDRDKTTTVHRKQTQSKPALH